MFISFVLFVLIHVLSTYVFFCRLYFCCCVSLCIIIKNTGAESVGYKEHDRKGRGAESVGYIMWQVAAAKFILLSPWMNYFSEV